MSAQSTPKYLAFFLALDVGLRNTGVAYHTSETYLPNLGLVEIPRTVWNDTTPSFKAFEEYIRGTEVIQNIIWDMKDAQVKHGLVHVQCFIERPGDMVLSAPLRKDRRRKQQIHGSLWHLRYWQRFIQGLAEELQVKITINDTLMPQQWRRELHLDRTKEAALQYAKDTYDIEGITDHEADAVCILDACAMRRIETPRYIMRRRHHTRR